MMKFPISVTTSGLSLVLLLCLIIWFLFTKHSADALFDLDKNKAPLTFYKNDNILQQSQLLDLISPSWDIFKLAIKGGDHGTKYVWTNNKKYLHILIPICAFSVFQVPSSRFVTITYLLKISWISIDKFGTVFVIWTTRFSFTSYRRLKWFIVRWDI